MLEAARVGIHVLNLETLIDVFATAGDDRQMQDFLRVGERRIRMAAVGDQNGVFGDDWFQKLGRGRRGEVVQEMIGRGAAAVARDQDCIVVVRRSARFLGLSAAFVWNQAN